MINRLKDIVRNDKEQYDVVKQDNQDSKEPSTESTENSATKENQPEIQKQQKKPEVILKKPKSHSLYGSQQNQIEINIIFIKQNVFIQPVKCELKKGQLITIDQPILFILKKEFIKHTQNTFYELLGLKSTRYLLLQDTHFIVLMNKQGKQFQVKSLISLKLMYKIIQQDNEINFCFYNNELSKTKSPQVIQSKIYFLKDPRDQKVRLMIRLRSELFKLGLDFEIIHQI